MKVGFAGTPVFAAQALKAIISAGFEVSVVLTQPDRPAGRGMKLQVSAVKQVAQDLNIPVLQPVSLRYGQQASEVISALKQCGVLGQAIDVLVVAAYGLILPQEILDIPRFGCLNIHASLLPRWRGAAPIQRAIEFGDIETGITIMQMDAGLDTGAVCKMAKLQIVSQTTAQLHNELALLGGQLIVSCLKELQNGALQSVPQPVEGVSYAEKIEKKEALLDFSFTASQVARKIAAFDPFPGAFFKLTNKLVNENEDTQIETHIKCFDAKVIKSEQSSNPGKIVAIDKDGVLVQCRDGQVCIASLQKPGGKRAPAMRVLQSLSVSCGKILNSLT